MLAISIVLFVVPDNSYLVMFQHYFTCRVSLFRNQNLNIEQSKTSSKPIVRRSEISRNLSIYKIHEVQESQK